MALTAEKQARFEELAARRQTAQESPESPQIDLGVQSPQPEAVQPQAGQQAAVSGLTPEKQARLDELRARREGFEQNQDRINQLLGVLGGRIPSLEPEKLPPLAGGPGPVSAVGKLTQQQNAFKELQTKFGMTPEQIRLASQTQKVLGRPRIGRPVGGIVGALGATALAGRFIPGPFDDAAIFAALIASGGAGFGGIAGEAAQTALEEKRLIGKREALSAFANESLTELGGRTVVGLGKFALSPFIKKIVPEAASLVDDFAKVGGDFSPTELDRRFSLRIGEAFSRGSFGAKEIFQEFEERQGKASLAFARNIIDSIGEGVARETPEQIGNIFAEGITRPGGRIFNILDDLVNPLYKRVDDLAKKGAQAGFRQAKTGGKAIRGITERFQPAKELQRVRTGPKVSTKTLKTFAKKHLATDKRLNGQFLSPIGRSKLEKTLGLKENLFFSDMRTLRSSFLKDTRKLARDVDQSQGIIKQLAGITDQAIFDPKSAQGLNPKALNLLRNTNALYKSAQEGIKTTFSESLAKRLLKNPSSVVKQVFPNNNPQAIRLLRKSLVEPISGKPSAEGKVLWNQLRQAWLADAVDQASKEGIAKPKVLDNLFRKLGKSSLREMFPEKEIANNVKKIQTLFETAGRVPPTGASLFSRGAQVGGLALMYNSGKEGDFVGFTAGAALTMGPLAFAKLATTPRGIKFLTAGLKLKPGAKGLVPNVVRMVRLLREINRQEQKVLRPRRKVKVKTGRGRFGLPLLESLP